MAMRHTARLDEWLLLIRGEFSEVPHLRLSVAQAARRWNLDSVDMGLILEIFTGLGFLCRSSDGSYFRPPPA